jgi:hypothetical protein
MTSKMKTKIRPTVSLAEENLSAGLPLSSG